MKARSCCVSLFTFLVVLLLAAGCSSGSYSSGSNSGTSTNAALVPVTLSMQDLAPAGVSLVSFEINVASATLSPGNVPLLVKNTDIELTHLQSEPALIGSLSVPAGNYTGLNVTFSSTAQISLVNTSGPAITLGGTSCPSGSTTVCSGTINVNPTSISAPITVALSANSPLGFIVHFDLNQSIVNSSGALTVSPAIDIRKILPQNGVMHEQHVVGTITALSSPNFTLQPGLGGPGGAPPAVTIATDSNTKFAIFDDPDDRPKLPPACTGNAFSCLAVGQTVRVTLNVQTSGTLLATQVGLFDADDRNSGLHGIVTSVNKSGCPTPSATSFQLALLGGEFKTASNAGIGANVTVNVASGAAYKIDLDNLVLPAGLSFANFCDLAVGQAVQVQLTTVPQMTGGALTVTTNRVRLIESVVTGTLTANPSGTPPQFTLGSLPQLFGSGATVSVKTLSNTKFCANNSGTVACQSGVTGLATGDTVSAGGLLFGNTTPSTMLAEGVLKRN